MRRNGYTLAVGLASLALLLILPRFTRRVPAVLITVVLSTLAVALLDLKDKGVTTVGSLPQGLPRPQFPIVALGDIGTLLAAAIGITLVSLADTIATSTSFAARRGDEVDASQEMIGIGAANAFAGLFQGFPVSTSGSRTAVAEQGGAKSQVTGLVGAGLVAIMLLFLPDLLANLPNSALAAIVIAAALSLMDIATVAKFRRVRTSAFVPGDDGHAGRRVVRRARRDPDRGRALDPGLLQAELVAQRPGARQGRLARRLAQPSTPTPTPRRRPASSCSAGRRPCSSPTRACSARRSTGWSGSSDAHWVVVQCEAITDIDVTAADMLERLDRELNQRGVHLVFVELRSRLHELVTRYGLLETLDQTALLRLAGRRPRRHRREGVSERSRSVGADDVPGRAGPDGQGLPQGMRRSSSSKLSYGSSTSPKWPSVRTICVPPSRSSMLRPCAASHPYGSSDGVDEVQVARVRPDPLPVVRVLEHRLLAVVRTRGVAGDEDRLGDRYVDVLQDGEQERGAARVPHEHGLLAERVAREHGR